MGYVHCWEVRGVQELKEKCLRTFIGEVEAFITHKNIYNKKQQYFYKNEIFFMTKQSWEVLSIKTLKNGIKHDLTGFIAVYNFDVKTKVKLLQSASKNFEKL